MYLYSFYCKDHPVQQSFNTNTQAIMIKDKNVERQAIELDMFKSVAFLSNTLY